MPRWPRPHRLEDLVAVLGDLPRWGLSTVFGALRSRWSKGSSSTLNTSSPAPQRDPRAAVPRDPVRSSTRGVGVGRRRRSRRQTRGLTCSNGQVDHACPSSPSVCGRMFSDVRGRGVGSPSLRCSACPARETGCRAPVRGAGSPKPASFPLKRPRALDHVWSGPQNPVLLHGTGTFREGAFPGMIGIMATAAPLPMARRPACATSALPAAVLASNSRNMMAGPSLNSFGSVLTGASVPPKGPRRTDDFRAPSRRSS